MLVQSKKSELNACKSQTADEWTTTNVLKSCLKCKYWYLSHFSPVCKSHLKKVFGRRKHILPLSSDANEANPTWENTWRLPWFLETTDTWESQTRLAIMMDAECESHLYVNLHKLIREGFSPKNANHTFFSWDQTANVGFGESRNSCNQKALQYQGNCPLSCFQCYLYRRQKSKEKQTTSINELAIIFQ